jgi:Family of unknown function (DUF5652)
MSYTISNTELAVFLLLAAWELTWKGLALWRASGLRQPYWFVVLLIVNSLGIFPIIYLLLTNNPDTDAAKKQHKSDQ